MTHSAGTQVSNTSGGQSMHINWRCIVVVAITYMELLLFFIFC